MNFVLRASEDKLRFSLLKTAWIPIVIYALALLYKSHSFNLAFSVLLFGLFIVLGLVQLYVHKFKYDIFINYILLYDATLLCKKYTSLQILLQMMHKNAK